MKKYIYTASTVCYKTLQIGKEQKQFSFSENEVYELPANDLFVKKMVAQKHLVPFKTFKTDK